MAFALCIPGANAIHDGGERVDCLIGFDCVRRHCSACSVPPSKGVCMEYGFPRPGNQVDEDCCAAPGMGGCAEGYVATTAGGACFNWGEGVTTCCEPVGGCTSDNTRDDSALLEKEIENPCLEWNYPEEDQWQSDSDCCAFKEHAACATGFDLSHGSKCFEFFGCVAYETKCTPSKDVDKVTRSEGAPEGGECEPDFGPLIGIIVGIVICICCCGGIGGGLYWLLVISPYP